MRELGQAYDDLKKKVKTEYEPQLQSLKSRIQELESRKPEDAAPVLAKLQSLEKRNEELERHMALVAYEESQDFKTKYDQPYRDTWNRATAAFSQLTVREADGVDELGEPKFVRRAATEEDLIELGTLPLSQLDEKAQAMFGASAPRAIQYIERLRELAVAKQTAVEEARTKAGEWKSQRAIESQTQQKARETAWAEINQGLAERFPKAFQAEEGNAEDQSAHTKGFALADLLFQGGAALTPEQAEALPNGFKEAVKAGKPLSEVQKVQLHAIARLKIANHDRLITRLKARDARIAELEKSLADYEKSEPQAGKAGEGGATGDKPWEDTVADELKALDR